MQRRFVPAAPVSAVCLIALAGTTASGGPVLDRAWEAPVSGGWNQPLRWNPDGVPDNADGNSYRAIVAVEGAAYTISFNKKRKLTRFELTSRDAVINQLSFDLIVEDSVTLSAGAIMGNGSTAELTVGGDLIFQSVAGPAAAVSIQGMGINANGNVSFENEDDDLDIDDTDVGIGGKTAVWTGGGGIVMSNGATITIGESTTFDLQSDATLSFSNVGATPTVTINGTLTKSAGAGTSEFQGVNLVNNGLIQVETGTFATDGIGGGGSTLPAGGAYIILDNAALDFGAQTLDTNDADVTLSGANSVFSAFDTVTTNNGRFAIENGRDFTTVDGSDFTNSGELSVADGSLFRVDPGQTLTNFSGTTLTGGTFIVGGELRFDGANIVTLAASLTLDGDNATVTDETGDSALDDSLAVIGPAGHFTLTGGADFQTVGDFTVDLAGLLTVDAGSLFRVAPGFELTNIPSNTFSDGIFDIQGTLQADNLDITIVDNTLTLDGPDASLLNGNGDNSLAGLTTVGPNGILSLLNGAELNVNTDLDVQGQLIIGGGGVAAGSGSEVLTINGNLVSSGTVRLLGGGSLSVTGLFTMNDGVLRGDGTITADTTVHSAISPGTGDEPYETLTINGDLTLAAGSTFQVTLASDPGLGLVSCLLDVNGELSLLSALASAEGPTINITVNPGLALQEGDSFLVATFDALTGRFALPMEGQYLGHGLRLVPVYTPTSLHLVVMVPSPATPAALLLFGLVCPSRRR